MRGDDQQSRHLFSYLSPEQRVPADHPLRAIRQMTDAALRELSPQFERLYATTGRPSIPPEQLAKLYRKGDHQGAVLGYIGHVLLDNCHGLIAGTCVTPATDRAECEAATGLLASWPAGDVPIGAEKSYDKRPFVEMARQLGATPHVAQRARGSALDGRTTGHADYAVSQKKRKLVEQVFGWMKTTGLLRQVRHRGGGLVEWIFCFTAAAFNLTRMRRLLAA